MSKNEMKVYRVPLKDIRLDPSNSRKHTPDNLSAIRESLQEFAQQVPIVIDQTGMIIKGEGTYLAAKSLHWKEIQAVISGLSGDSAAAYAIADNRSGQLGGWKMKTLRESLERLEETKKFNLSRLLHFKPFELKPPAAPRRAGKPGRRGSGAGALKPSHRVVSAGGLKQGETVKLKGAYYEVLAVRRGLVTLKPVRVVEKA